MNKAAVHNLNEERSVGFINYKIHLRGKTMLEIFIKKYGNQQKHRFVRKLTQDIKGNLKPAQEVKQIKMQWKEKIRVNQVWYDLLEKLKKEELPGLFTSKAEIKRYLLLNIDDDTKNKQISDVTYVRISCMSLKPTAAVF